MTRSGVRSPSAPPNTSHMQLRLRDRSCRVRSAASFASRDVLENGPERSRTNWRTPCPDAVRIHSGGRSVRCGIAPFRVKTRQAVTTAVVTWGWRCPASDAALVMPWAQWCSRVRSRRGPRGRWHSEAPRFCRSCFAPVAPDRPLLSRAATFSSPAAGQGRRDRSPAKAAAGHKGLDNPRQRACRTGPDRPVRRLASRKQSVATVSVQG